jgi:hypothetical protein
MKIQKFRLLAGFFDFNRELENFSMMIILERGIFSFRFPPKIPFNGTKMKIWKKICISVVFIIYPTNITTLLKC